MADDPVVETPVAAVEPEPIIETPTPEPHPLEPGGKRFEEVYGRMKQAEAAAQEQRDRIARLEGAVQAAQRPPVQQPVYWSPDQLQTMVDQGRLTPIQAADVVAAQRQAVSEQRVAQFTVLHQKQTVALNEVKQYMARIPTLSNQSSPEFQRVARLAYETAEDTGLPVSDPRVQRQALRAAFGTLEKVAQVAVDHEAGRLASIPHSESGGGGSPSPVPAIGAEALAGVPKRYLEFWKLKGYDAKRMAEEAALITEKQRAR